MEGTRMAKRMADAEAMFKVVNISPDFCRVNGEVIAFDIEQILPPEKEAYSPDVLARGEKVLKLGSLVAGVEGNAGDGVLSTVSQRDGHTLMIDGDEKVLVNSSPVCRHGHLCLMNVKV